MRRKRDSRGRFIARGGISIPTTPPTPPRLRRDTPPSQTHIHSHRPLEVLRLEIQSIGSSTSSNKLVPEEENIGCPIEGVAFFTSTGEHILVEELRIPSGEEEVEPFFHIPLIEEPEEEQLTLQVESYINFEETIMVEEGEDGEFSLFGGGGRGRGRGNNGECRGNNGRRRGNREVDNSFGFLIVDEEIDATMKNI